MTILSPQLGISPTATTGGEAYDRELLKRFVALGIKIKILLPRNTTFPEELKSTIEFTLLSHFVPPYLFNVFSFPWVLQNRKQQILRIHSPEYLFLTAILIKKLIPDLPIIVHYHLDQAGWLWTKTNKILLNIADAVITDSEFLKKQLVERVGVDGKRINVIHCGVDINVIKPELRRKWSPACPGVHSHKTILFLGRFIERKRPDFALQIFAELHRKHPLTKLVMVGEGPMEKELRAQSKKLNVEDAIEFPGPLFGQEKLRRYHQADLFLFPSEKEGFVLVVLEAMAAGLPLLVPNSLGFPEAVEHGKNGLLVGKELSEWTKGAEKILYSPLLNQSMRKHSRFLAVSKFSWALCAKRNIAVYKQVLRKTV